ncbi:PA3496 family putative envelope integrity protein [Methyloglobulus sp.]|uniref:PA3496 family putative envelope integrity protein n=1 Tax=Methyloglobulus sp. TaxID=2518622 RepID=UPI003989A2C2
MAIAIETSQSLTGITIPEPDADQNKESLHHIDLEDFDVNANEDGLALPPEDELTTKKMASRRKIEIYWEKKRLQGQLDDFSEIDFDF